MSKSTPLAALYAADYQLTALFGLAQYWHDKKSFFMTKPRPTHALLLFAGCDAVYEETDGARISVPRGSLFFLSAGSQYLWSFSNTKAGEVSTLLLEFSLTDEGGAPFSLSESSQVLFHTPSDTVTRLLEEAVKELSAPTPIPARAKAKVYALLAEIAGEGRTQGAGSGRLATIKKSIRYLEEDPSQALPIADVAALSNVSVNYFERLFKDYAGVTPAEYRAARRIERAQRLLLETFLTVGEIAFSLGFEDEAYFCRFFKSRTGISPGAYRKTRG